MKTVRLKVPGESIDLMTPKVKSNKLSGKRDRFPDETPRSSLLLKK